MKGICGFIAFVGILNVFSSQGMIPWDVSDKEYAAIPGAHSMKRAAPDSPTGGYAPGNVECPSSRPVIRAASALSDNETAWLQLRRNKTIGPMTSILTRANISGFDASKYISSIAGNASALPNIGIAISGGGYRAMLNGAGFVAAADSRTENSTNAGGIGGLLQSATYLSGLSGGAWLVGSLYANNFSTVTTLRDGSPGSSVWEFGNSILKGPDSSGLSIANIADYYNILQADVDSKSNAGYETTITDYWGRALSFQLVNASNGGPAYTFSSIALDKSFVDGESPFPVLVADARAPGTMIISLNSTVYEFNPFEFGSWDPTTYGFAPLRYIGSNFSGGVVLPKTPCVRGFDQVGFIMGTSSSLFNQFILQINSTAMPNAMKNSLTSILERIGSNENDVSLFKPNPFFGYNNSTNDNSHSSQLTLVDGGEDGQNIPLSPLIQPFRALDVIFAVDSSADTGFYWPNGTSLVATYRRSLNATLENGTIFPAIPDQNTFINLGLNNRPSFFGCNASNLTGEAPLIVYVPNAPYIIQSNFSTFKPDYSNVERNLMIQNGYDIATMGNGTMDMNSTSPNNYEPALKLEISAANCARFNSKGFMVAFLSMAFSLLANL
ncbi:Lysophospholipase [Venustampulla echinocandica]|uniref:Lysophospholipase n=1 Tax=Venustampulla echinocandica TaxID=2656787 RepID=A0A370TA25_9HELO|nr:Lysophospholipase [Venustampulla echinocandica]RDL30495.1 Lysophospholipase [Venustampulla echinocandica]